MNLFEENVWEIDETGDKLTKELFSGKKKSKPVEQRLENTTRSEKRLKKNCKKKTENISKSELSVEESGSESRNNKKRKSSDINIDKDFIKKWKLASNNRGEIITQREFSNKTNEPTDKSSKREKSGKLVKKTKSKETNDDKKKPNAEVKDPTSTDVMTKSQKRRLKNKLKVLNSQKDSQGKETASRLNGEQNTTSRNLNNSDKMKRSQLKIEKIKKFLTDKEQRSSKINGNVNESKSLRERMLARLKSSRFRYLNEQMYNSESWSSKKYFKDDPDAFFAYHEGYKLQVEQWPLNPLDTIIAAIKKLPKDYVVADFGCGEAKLAESVAQKVHSLDLVAINDKVIACDMAHTTLLTGRIDVVVFCLSLMGTNLTDYLIEANRVLRKDGILKIAEVESRFEDIDEFIKILSSYGFVNTWKDFSNDLFYFMDFKKDSDVTKKRNKLPSVTLKSCLYKRR